MSKERKSPLKPFNDDEDRALLNFVNEHKEVLLNPSNKANICAQKGTLWQHLANDLSAPGKTNRTEANVRNRWENIRRRAKSDWETATTKKPTGGGIEPEWNWQTKFIVETLQIEFISTTKFEGNFDTAGEIFTVDSSARSTPEDPNFSEYIPNDETLLTAAEIKQQNSGAEDRPSTSRKKPKIENDNNAEIREQKYMEILDMQKKVYSLQMYKIAVFPQTFLRRELFLILCR